MFIEPEKINITAKEKEFFDTIYFDPEKAEQAVDDLFGFFQPLSFIKDRDYWLTYFRWYTMLTWKRLSSFPKEFVVEEAWQRQIPMALLCDFDVWNELIWYIVARAWPDDEMKIFYADVRSTFLASGAIIGNWQEKEITIKDMIEKINVMKRPGATSLDTAEVAAKIKNTFFPKNDPEFYKYIPINPDTVVARFINLVDHFLQTEQDGIKMIVDAVVHPKITVETVSPPLKSKKNPIEEKITTKPVVVFTDIKRVVENKFTKKPDGQFTDPTKALTMLNDLAARYKDDRIRELYIFNEKTGAFEWNNNLLTR